MGILKTTSIMLMCLASLVAEARVISYSGGSTLMVKSDSLKDTVYYHYSPSYKYSIGIEDVRDKFLRQNYSYFRVNVLLNRKNTRSSQRNLYFQSGVSSNGFSNFFYGIHGDWETRRLFGGFGYKKNQTDIKNFQEQYIQFGIAPYLGDYGDLHSWLMVKTKKNMLDDKWHTYPSLKLFKSNALVEIAYSKRSNWDIHLMYRF